MTPLETLLDRCRREGVRLLYAAERGSRCYGTEADGSDWDIQAVVACDPLAYASVQPPPPVWTSEYGAGVSTTLFNAPRAAIMLAKGSVKLREAAFSACVLHDAGGIGERMRALADAGFDRHVARQQHLRFMDDAVSAMPSGGESAGRRWLHYLLPLLSELYVARHDAPAPVTLAALLEARLDPFVSEAAVEALAAKRDARPVAFAPGAGARLLALRDERAAAVLAAGPGRRGSQLGPELLALANALSWDLIGVSR